MGNVHVLHTRGTCISTVMIPHVVTILVVVMMMSEAIITPIVLRTEVLVLMMSGGTYVPPLITVPCNVKTPLMELARRPVADAQIPVGPIIHAYVGQPPICKDFCEIQDAWDTYISNVSRVCNPTFWNFFLKLHTLSRAAIDSALHAAKICFNSQKTLEHFPSSLRTL